MADITIRDEPLSGGGGSGIRASLNDVPLETITPIKWRLQCGISPVTSQFKVRESFEVKEGVTDIELKMACNDQEMTFKKLLLINRSWSNVGQLDFLLADQRYLWKYTKLYQEDKKWSRFNLTRPTGIVERFNKFSDAGIASFRYLPYSLNPTKNSPWTCLEIVEHILKVHLGYTNVRFDIKDNERVQDNILMDGLDAPSALAQVLPLADANLYIDPDGDPVVYDVTAEIKDWQGKRYEGKIFYQGQLCKPEVIRIYFLKEQEIKLNTIDLSTTASNGLINVTRCPLDMTVGGTDYKKGQYVRIDQLLSENGINYELFVTRFVRPQGTLQLFFDAFDIELGVKLNEEQRIKLQIYSAVMRDFRTLWMIPRTSSVNGVDCDNLVEWNPYRINIEDNLTGARAPAEIFADYFDILAYRRLDKSGEPMLDGSVGHVKDFNEVTPAAVTEIDINQGVFRVGFGFDETATIKARYFGSLTDQIPLDADTEMFMWDDIKLDRTMEMSAIMSCVRADDMWYYMDITTASFKNGDKIKDKTPENRPNKSEPLTLSYFCMRDRARFGFDSSYTDVELINEPLLTEILLNEQELLEHAYGNFLLGYIEAEFSAVKVDIQGNMQYIEWVIDDPARSACRTIYDAMSLPAPASQWSSMTPQLRTLTFKSLSSLQSQEPVK